MSGKIEIGLASNEDGDDILGLVLASGFEIPGLDWHDIYSHWLVHESAREKRDELLPYIADDIAMRVIELSSAFTPALH